MYRDDLVSQVRASARLCGPNEARRAVAAVLSALPAALSGPLLSQLPGLPDFPPVKAPLADTASLVATVAARLHIDEPNAAFLCRVVFAHLNTAPHGITPARLAHLAPPEIRSMLCARPEDPAARILARLGALRPLGIAPETSVEKSAGVVSIRTRPVRPLSEKVDGTWS
jgi:uncharacterized protein (DUF2267 family)